MSLTEMLTNPPKTDEHFASGVGELAYGLARSARAQRTEDTRFRFTRPELEKIHAEVLRAASWAAPPR